MKKILRTDNIAGLFTVDIEGRVSSARIGDLISDDNGNLFKLTSVALSGSKLQSPILVLERINGTKPIGGYLDIE